MPAFHPAWKRNSLRDLQQLYLKSLERELDIAREIQLGFLPSRVAESGWLGNCGLLQSRARSCR